MDNDRDYYAEALRILAGTTALLPQIEHLQALRGEATRELPQDWKDIFAEYKKDRWPEENLSDAWLYQQIEAHIRRADRKPLMFQCTGCGAKYSLAEEHLCSTSTQINGETSKVDGGTCRG